MTIFLDSPYPSKVTLMMCGDIVSTLSKLEEVGAHPPPEPLPQCPCPKGHSAETSPRQPSDADLSTLPGVALSLCPEMVTAVAFSPWGGR